MKDTIKARDGFRVVKVKNIVTGDAGYRIDDGAEPLFVAQKRSYADYKDEKRQNDMFRSAKCLQRSRAINTSTGAMMKSTLIISPK